MAKPSPPPSEGPVRTAESLDSTLGPEIDDALLSLDELAQEDPEEALSMFDALPEPVQALVDFQLLLARVHQSLGQLEAARDILLELKEAEEQNPDVHHQLGDVLEDLGQTDEANECFETTRALDEATYGNLTDEYRNAWEREVRSIMATIERTLSSRSFSTRVENLPSDAAVKAGCDPRALAAWDSRENVLTAYAANLNAEYSDLDEEERDREIPSGIASYLAEDMDLKTEELDSFE